MADQDIPSLKRAQLGVGVRGKYFKQFTENSNVVESLAARPKRAPRKRVAA